MLSCHGLVPIDFDYGISRDVIFRPTIIPFKYFDIKSMDVVTLSKLGGVCFGDESQNNIIKYIDYINKNRHKLYEEQNIRNTEQLVNYLFGDDDSIRTLVIKNLNKSLYHHSFPPEITELKEHTIEKIYKPLVSKSETEPEGAKSETESEGAKSETKKILHGGVHYLSSDGFTGLEMEKIKTILKECNEELYKNEFLTKSHILSKLKEFKIDKLYYIDFSCYAYQNSRDVALNEEAVNWLNASLEKLKGGKTKKRRYINRRKNNNTKNNNTKNNKTKNNKTKNNKTKNNKTKNNKTKNKKNKK